MDGFFDDSSRPASPVHVAPPPTPVQTALAPGVSMQPHAAPHHVHFYAAAAAAAPVLMMPYQYAHVFQPVGQAAGGFSQGVFPPLTLPVVGRRVEAVSVGGEEDYGDVGDDVGDGGARSRGRGRREVRVGRGEDGEDQGEGEGALSGPEERGRGVEFDEAERLSSDDSHDDSGGDGDGNGDDGGGGPRYPRYSRRVQSKSEPWVLGTGTGTGAGQGRSSGLREGC
jgi:hypothetical protein